MTRAARATRDAAEVTVGPAARPGSTARRVRSVVEALEQLAGGIGTGVLAALALVAVVVTVVLAPVLALAGPGRGLVPATARLVGAVADRERARLGLPVAGTADPGGDRAPAGLAAAVTSARVRREVAWVAVHATLGLLLGVVGIGLPLNAVRDLTFPLWWGLLSDGTARTWLPFWTVTDQASAWVVGLVGVGWGLAAVALVPGMAWLQRLPGRRWLAPDRHDDLVLRVTHLTATRAAALDAHVAELRRIERALHDGAQNRLIAVTVLLGAARRSVAEGREGREGSPDAAGAAALLDRAQDAAEQALGELRAVVRSILPPVLADRSLPDALAALAATCPVPCRLEADVPGRCPASVEATAYFAVAEALTNVARHSAATSAAVTVEVRDGRLHVSVRDDGRGGADEAGGSGLSGIRRRVEAHDGSLALSSPPGGPTRLDLELPCAS